MITLGLDLADDHDLMLNAHLLTLTSVDAASRPGAPLPSDTAAALAARTPVIFTLAERARYGYRFYRRHGERAARAALN